MRYATSASSAGPLIGWVRSRFPPLTGEPGEPLKGLLNDVRLIGAAREANGLHQHLRVAGLLTPVASQDRARLPVETEGVEQPQHAEHRLPVARLAAPRLEVVRQRPVAVAELLGGLCREPARDAVVRPQTQARIQRLQGLGGPSSSQQQAAAQQIRDDRLTLQLRYELFRLVVVPRADQQVDEGGQRRGTYPVGLLQALRHGVPRLGGLVALFVVVRQAEPGLAIVDAIRRGRQQQPLGLFTLPVGRQPVGQGHDELQLGRRRFVRAAQDLEAARVR
jgi:hypothetical protein